MKVSLQTFVLLFVLFSVLFLSCDGRRKRRFPRKKSGRIEVELSEGSGDGENITAKYSDWSTWSRCNRNCRQFRRRRCLNVSLCENTVQKIDRACYAGLCRQKILLAVSGDSKRKPTKPRILSKLSPFFFSEWSPWSSCSSTCYMKRTRKCLFPGLCNNSSKREDYKQCYKSGDECEKMYFERQQRLPSDLEITESPSLSEDHPLDNITCGLSNVSIDLRITGGRPSVKGNWPWQSLILNGDFEPFCGGILLSENWVLTAAHCIRRKLYVRTGEYDLSHFEKTEQQELVSSIYVYPTYHQTTVDNDIALLKVQRPFQLNTYVLPICLPRAADRIPTFARATILGWGKRRNFSTYGTDILHQAEVPIVPPEECQDSYFDQYISENMICAGFEDGKVDSCKGDSGGPLMHKRNDGRWAVFGVTSFGDGCGGKRKYGVYANVIRYLSWIRSIIQSEEVPLYDDE